MTASLLPAVLLASLASAFALDFSALDSLPVQDAGRKKPFLVFAEESLAGISGKTSAAGPDGHALGAVATTASIWLAPEAWTESPLILVTDKKLVVQVGLDPSKKRFSHSELSSNEKLRTLFAAASQSRAMNPPGKLSPLLKSASDTGLKMDVFQRLSSGQAVVVLPSGTGAWIPLPSNDPALAKLREGVLNENQAAFDEGVRLLRTSQAAASPQCQADPQKIVVETFFQRLHPFRWAWVLYLAAGLALLVSGGHRVGYWLAWVFSLLGFSLQILGFACRVMVSGRAPVTNMYESVVWVAFGTVLFALVFEALHRCRYFLMGAIPVAVVSLILADTQPVILDRSIRPLVPVLADNFWLTTHVLTITLSYAAFALALGVAHIALGKMIVGTKPSKALSNYLYRTLQVGVLLLATGTILGGVWANYSWGRFWDWDPKETWALIALLGYLFLLHGRIAGKWGDFGLAVGAVLAFQSIIMAWYGVNFVLGVGLHSYGFGSGGFPLALAFVLAELAFVGLAVARKTAFTRPISRHASEKVC